MHLTDLSTGHLRDCVSVYVCMCLAWNFVRWSVGDGLQVEQRVHSDW